MNGIEREKKSDRWQHKARERERGSEKERERDSDSESESKNVIIISNTPARGRSEKGQERGGQRCR